MRRGARFKRMARSTRQLRQEFLRYFEQNGHKRVESASLIPSLSDPSLLYINAGMAPHKKMFLGEDSALQAHGTDQLVSCQRCVRAGGKHNDLDQVGYTPRHHTLFEMLGNFSFGKYLKEESIFFAWNFLTKTLELDAEKLRVTVLDTDEESRLLWKKIAQLPDSRIVALDQSENFWSMGDIGPCGPCTEIFYDVNPNHDQIDERWLEIWNLVFMQYERVAGSDILKPLPLPCVDTGMGLERMASVLQGVSSNFHTDGLKPLVDRTAHVVDRFGGQVDASSTVALQVIADHVRTATVLMADGVYPSNVRRGYVLRRIIRRAIRYGQSLGVRQPFLQDLVGAVAENMDGHADGLTQALVSETESIQRILEKEQENFLVTLDRGAAEMKKIMTRYERNTILSGHDAFQLYDTFGVPLDSIRELARKNELNGIDTSEFNNLLEGQRARARHDFKSADRKQQESNIVPGKLVKGWHDLESEFLGYSTLESKAQVVAFDPETKWIVISPCVFYAQGGGQVSDRGYLEMDGVKISVVDAQAITNRLTVLRLDPEANVPSTSTCHAVVDPEHRQRCAVHHSATHLLHSALCSTLGNHVTQAGSLVDAKRLRFDFTHPSPLSRSELKEIETLVNQYSQLHLPVVAETLERKEADETGAKAAFGEKYGDTVRIVSIGDVSNEFCGGTHVKTSSEIWPFCIQSEGSSSAGVRRIEATAGKNAIDDLLQHRENLQEIATSFDERFASSFTVKSVEKLQQQVTETETTWKSLLIALASTAAVPIFSNSVVEVHVVEPIDRLNQKDRMLFFRKRAQFLMKNNDQKLHIVVMGEHVAVGKKKNANCGSAKAMFASIASELNLRGGGNDEWAQGKGNDQIQLKFLLSLLG